MSHDSWIVTNNRCDPHSLGQFNSVFTISNGYLGIKGNLQEDRDGYCPVTLINGVYDELDMFGLIRASKHERRWLDPDYFDTAGKSPAVANLPDPLFVQVFVGDREVSLQRGRISAFQQMLDLRCGLYQYTYDYGEGVSATRISASRFASLAHPHRVYMRYQLTPLADTRVRIVSGINARVHSDLTKERQFSVVGMESGPNETCRLQVRTRARQHDVRLVVANRFSRESGSTSVRNLCAHDAVYTQYEFCARAGQPITLDRVISLHSSEDARHGQVASPDEDVVAAVREGFDVALARQRSAWQELWERADVRIDGDDTAQRYLRFCLYHLLAAAPRFTDKLSVPVKLLTGDYYQGTTFYDTDTYIVPFYTFTLPEHARTCLSWRYEGLARGRELARELGYHGAKFAWQAGPYGEECLGRWQRFTHTNIHINGDVAYSLMQYYWATRDEALMRKRGIDMLVESARFYASRAIYDQVRGAYEIHNVAGPDEAHCESTNNFYTNYVAIRTLRWAADMVARLQRNDVSSWNAVVRRLGLREGELQRWIDVAEHLTLPFDPQTRLYEQYDGFYQLPPPPPDLLQNRKEWFVPLAPYQALNQPDVLMAMVLFRDDFPADVRRANWEYYRDKSMNFSSMSYALNAIMAADMGEMEEAYRNFMTCAGVDLDETRTGRGDTYTGLHGTALGGAWMVAVFGFGGVYLSEAGLRVNPNLPPSWTGLRFNLMLRGEIVRVAIGRHELTLKVGDQTSIELPARVAGQPLQLRSGQEYRVAYSG
jgi:trehalose/maltose hydrolase-like predicted phosphorylase